MGYKPHEEDQEPWIDPSRTQGWFDHVRPRPSRNTATPAPDEDKPRLSPEELRQNHMDALVKQRDTMLARLTRSNGLEFRQRCLERIAFLNEQIKAAAAEIPKQPAENHPPAQKPGPKGPRSSTARRQLDIKAVGKEIMKDGKKKRGWETNACMKLNAMHTPLPSKRLQQIHKGSWVSWLRTDRQGFLKQWSKDVKSD